ncbi:MAG: hypothetical protein QOI74_4081 [Micromonosporaceae bacterium]|nr:hypothetical protein [Micromonosporaceae bacterium]
MLARSTHRGVDGAAGCPLVVPAPRKGDRVYGVPATRGRSWAWRNAATIAAAAITVGSAGLLTVAISAGLLDRVPLLNGDAATVVEVLAGGGLVGSWLCAGRRWRRRALPVLLGAAVLVTGLLAATLWLTDTVTDAYPAWFGLLIAMAFTAMGGLPMMLRTPAGQPRRGALARARRGAAVVAVPLAAVGALMLIDNEYGIWPQVGDLLGHTRTAGGGVLQALHGLGRPGRAGAVPTKGVVAGLDVPGTISHFHHRSGAVYLPPAYFRAGVPDLPVLILLAGTPGVPINWIRAGGAESTADAYAATHRGVAPVLVVVDQNGSTIGDSECVDGPQGNAETFLTVDVPTFITHTLRVSRDPARWGIVGFSEGGTCALDLVVAHPDIYRHIVDLGGDTRPSLGGPQHTLTALFGGSVAAEQAHDPLRMLAARRYSRVTAWFGAGANDNKALAAAHRVAAAATKAGITARELTVAGAHNWQFAAAAFTQILPQLCTDMNCPDAAAGTGTP